MKKVIHYKKADLTPICYDGRNENLTTSLPETTCKNCLDIKRRESLSKFIDWNSISSFIKSLEIPIKERIEIFCSIYGYESRLYLGNYPPSIHVFIYQISQSKSGNTISLDIGPDLKNPNIVHVKIFKDDELDRIASFIGELADELQLRVRRDKQTPLSYEFKPNYKRF